MESCRSQMHDPKCTRLLPRSIFHKATPPKAHLVCPSGQEPRGPEAAPVWTVALDRIEWAGALDLAQEWEWPSKTSASIGSRSRCETWNKSRDRSVRLEPEWPMEWAARLVPTPSNFRGHEHLQENAQAWPKTSILSKERPGTLNFNRGRKCWTKELGVRHQNNPGLYLCLALWSWTSWFNIFLGNGVSASQSYKDSMRYDMKSGKWSKVIKTIIVVISDT